jgi:hypothetical protein
MQASLLYVDLYSFGDMPSCGILGYGSSIFSFLRNLHSDFHSGCTNLYSQKQYISVPFALQPHQYLLFVFLMIAVLSGIKWNLSVILICQDPPLDFTLSDLF